MQMETAAAGARAVSVPRRLLPFTGKDAGMAGVMTEALRWVRRLGFIQGPKHKRHRNGSVSNQLTNRPKLRIFAVSYSSRCSPASSSRHPFTFDTSA